VDTEFLGEVVWSPGYSVGMLEQEPQLDPDKTVKEVVEEAVASTVNLLKEFEAINEKFMDPALMDDPDAMDKLIEKQGEVQEKLDAANAWELDVNVRKSHGCTQICHQVKHNVKNALRW
jgi:energy-dependent translational throttle protein EttA